MSPGNLSKELREFLSRQNVKIRDYKEAERKILGLISGGINSLQVITDFDQTVTKYHQNGEICDSTYSVLTNSVFMPEDFKLQCELNFKKYGPIEINHQMSVEERIPYMIEWQNEFLKSLIKVNFNQSCIRKFTNQSKTYLRDNVNIALAKLHDAKVPVLIFSAGIEDILLEILAQNNAIFSNMRIVSNKMDFDEEQLLIGFRPPSIHTFNKNKNVLREENQDYFLELSHRNNVILLGDNIGDIHMADGMDQDSTTILKIGFLEEKMDAQLESYMREYDIVILDDQSWDLFYTLLRHIL